MSTTAGDVAVPVVEAPPASVSRRSRWPAARFALAVAAVAAIGWTMPAVLDTRSLSLLSRYLVFGIAALGLDLLWGRAGLLSFGHAAFFGLGAYACGLALQHDLGGGVALLLGIGLPALAGLLIGVVLFYGQIKGVIFGIITLLIALLAEQLAGTWGGLTAGFNGLIVSGGLELGPIRLVQAIESYYAVLTIAVAAYLATLWFSRTPFGRAVAASSMNDVRAASLGYDVAWLRSVTMAVAGGLGGLGGALYAPIEGFVYPAQMGLVASTTFIVWVAIGGRGTLVGAFVGVILVSGVQSLLSDKAQDWWPLLTGVFVLVVVLAEPGGIVGGIRDGYQRLAKLGGRRAGS